MIPRVRFVFLALLVMALPRVQHLLAAPEASTAPNVTASLADSSWVGARIGRAKGNSPAQLRILQENGRLTALLTCDAVEETLAITASAPSTLQLKGISFKDLKYSGRTFPLDFSLHTFTADLSQQGQQLTLTGVDSRGAHSRYEFRRVSSK